VREELPPEGPPRFEIRVLPDPSEAADAAARELVAAFSDSLADHGTFRVAFSGGSTPKLLFDRLAQDTFWPLVDWTRARVFFVDERCVPPGDERSNYRLAKEHLLDPLRVPPDNVFRMRGEVEPRRAAEEYDAALEREFEPESPPRFDYVLLGLGTDGHTASLFPGTKALEETSRRTVENYVPRLDEWRLTLTLPVLNAARRVVFLVVGKEKRGAVSAVLDADNPTASLPASLVRPDRGSLIWIVDEDAATRL
jgi:6-phosphogluconolactonase